MRISDTKWFPALLLFLAALIFCWPLFVHPFNWHTAGRHDADEFLAFMETERQPIVEYGQFPFWTPAIGGGQEAAAAVFSSALSPFFTVILLFGVIPGIKVVAVLFLFFGLWGMYLLARHLGCSRLAAYLPPVLFFFSSIYALQVTEGVYYNLALAALPWAILFYLRSLQDERHIVVSALFATLILFNGAPYPVFFYLFLFLLIYASLCAASGRSWQPLRLFFFLALLTVVFAAVRMIPMADFAGKHPILSRTQQYNGPAVLLRALFSRQQLLSVPRSELWGLPREVNFWELHGAYVGIVPFVFYVMALRRLGRRHAALVRTGWAFLALYALNVLLPPALKVFLDRMPLRLFFINPSRLVWMFLFSFSLTAGLGFGIMEEGARKNRRRLLRGVLWAALGLIALDLFLVNSPILGEAFERAPREIERRPVFVQTRVEESFERSLKYGVVRENRGLCVDNYAFSKGVLLFCHAVPLGADRYRGEVYLESGQTDRLRGVTLTPNVVTVELAAGDRDDLLVINQNYDAGWRVRGLKENKVICSQGLIAARVAPEDSGAATFFFFPVAFIAGGAISLAGAGAVLFLRKRRAFVPLLGLLAAASLVTYITLSVLGPAARRASPETCAAARHDAIQGAWAHKKGDLFLGTMYLESATAALPNSVSLHRMLREIYLKTGRTESARRQQQAIDSLLPEKAGERP